MSPETLQPTPSPALKDLLDATGFELIGNFKTEISEDGKSIRMHLSETRAQNALTLTEENNGRIKVSMYYQTSKDSSIKGAKVQLDMEYHPLGEILPTVSFTIEDGKLPIVSYKGENFYVNKADSFGLNSMHAIAGLKKVQPKGPATRNELMEIAANSVIFAMSSERKVRDVETMIAKVNGCRLIYDLNLQNADELKAAIMNASIDTGVSLPIQGLDSATMQFKTSRGALPQYKHEPGAILTLQKKLTDGTSAEAILYKGGAQEAVNYNHEGFTCEVKIPADFGYSNNEQASEVRFERGCYLAEAMTFAENVSGGREQALSHARQLLGILTSRSNYHAQLRYLVHTLIGNILA